MIVPISSSECSTVLAAKSGMRERLGPTAICGLVLCCCLRQVAANAFGRRQGLRQQLADAAANEGTTSWGVASALAAHRRSKARVIESERLAASGDKSNLRIRPVYDGASDAECAKLPERKPFPAEMLRGCHWDYEKITQPRSTCPAPSPLARAARDGQRSASTREWKGALMYLCIPVEACHFQYLSLSVLSWHHYWNRFFHYPVAIFSREEDKATIEAEIAPLRRAGVDLRVEVVDAAKWLPDPNIACPGWKQKSDEPCSRRFTESYRGMNRFFSKDMYWQPIFDDIDYFIRIDTDSFLVQVWCDDPFERMYRSGKRFLYNGIAVTNPNCHKGMRDAIDEFPGASAAVSPLQNYLRPDGDDRPAYGFSGCVGAGSAHFFRHDNYTRFSDFLRAKCGIYNHRWSEQVFFYYANAIYGTPSHVGKIDSPHIHGRDKHLWMTCLRKRLVDAGYSASLQQAARNEASVTSGATKTNDPKTADATDIVVRTPNCFSPRPRDPPRVLYTTVPRSGSTFLRRLLEYSTGLTTESVWPEGGTYSADTQAFGSCQPIDVFSGADGVRAKGTSCPKDLRRPSLHDPLFVKSHFPFQHREWKYMEGHRISAVLKSVRNPIDEYDSWRRWRGRHPEWPRFRMSFRAFAAAWAKFHRHWDNWSATNCVPIVEFKFEQLVSNTRNVLQKVLKHTGAWQKLSLSNDAIERAIRTVKQQDSEHRKGGNKVTGNLKLGQGIGKSYHGEHFGTDVTLADLEWFVAEHGDLLKQYGYENLFSLARTRLGAPGADKKAAKKLIVLSAPNAWLLQPTMSCPLRDCRGCEFSVDKARMKDADAVIFFARFIPTPPPERPAGQVWIFFTTESRRHFDDLPAAYSDAFNLTMTYKLDSDVPMTYLDRQWFRLLPFQDSSTFGKISDSNKMFLVAPKNRGKLNCDVVGAKERCKKSISGAFLNTGQPCPAEGLSNREYARIKADVLSHFTVKFPEKTADAPVMFMASNPIRCHQNCDKNDRISYVKELMKHTKVDSFGLVLHNKDSVNIGGKTFTMSGRKHGNWERPVVIKILSGYKFYLAFENSNCDDYLTEKFFRPLLAGSVPIVMGGCDYSKFAPSKNSYLHVKDFGTPAALAKYVNDANRDDKLYRKHLAWRTLPLEQLSSGFRRVLEAEKPECKLCKILKAGVSEAKVHWDINNHYWSKPKNCAADGWGEGVTLS